MFIYKTGSLSRICQKISREMLSVFRDKAGKTRQVTAEGKFQKMPGVVAQVCNT